MNAGMCVHVRGWGAGNSVKKLMVLTTSDLTLDPLDKLAIERGTVWAVSNTLGYSLVSQEWLPGQNATRLLFKPSTRKLLITASGDGLDGISLALCGELNFECRESRQWFIKIRHKPQQYRSKRRNKDIRAVTQLMSLQRKHSYFLHHASHPNKQGRGSCMTKCFVHKIFAVWESR